ncbi:MAG: T9SS type A sorting domain-containing protein [candidate division KSB1 bacterium]|nr:T9SS type A sorting domain-containing protein [candidate division KSB1 bacterium]
MRILRVYSLLIAIFLIPLYGHTRTLAFPGAEGAGRFTRGGRGGEVYIVTHLGDSGPGSLREAIEASGPRTVVFQVSGTIELESDLKIKSPYITIAGQTAPGDGICIKDHTLYVNHNEVIIRYMRFRLGDESGEESDAAWGRYCKNAILDHCSASWSVDEAFSFYGIDSLTIQRCLVSESLYYSHHEKGAHGYGGIWGGDNASFHHNLLAHHSSRNPRFSGGSTSLCVNVDFRNNVVYNWGFNSAYGGEGGTINMVANYFKAGPATKESVRDRIVNPSGIEGRWYVAENVVEGFPDISADNWSGGVQGGSAVKSIIGVDTPFPFHIETTQSAEEAYADVLQDVGANFPTQDAVDSRILSEVESGTATYEGFYYEAAQGFSDTSVVRGIIDSQDQVGGWPILSSAAAPADSDQDGMPDDWESDNGLDANDASDRNLTDARGYTMLERYINGLVSNPSGIADSPDLPESFTLLKNYPNPFNPSTRIEFNLPRADYVELNIYNMRGQLVNTLIRELCQAGVHTAEWNGTHANHQHVASGLYFAVLTHGNKTRVIKMQLLR